MSTYDFSQLVKLWGLESITSEQAIGQILLHLQSVRDRLTVVEKLLPRLEEEGGINQGEVINQIDVEEATEEVKQAADPDVGLG